MRRLRLKVEAQRPNQSIGHGYGFRASATDYLPSVAMVASAEHIASWFMRAGCIGLGGFFPDPQIKESHFLNLFGLK